MYTQKGRGQINKVKGLKLLQSIIYTDNVKAIKSKYKQFDGQRLFDLIFAGKERFNLKKDDLTTVWDQGNSIKSIDKTVTASIKGIHIYTLENGIILGIVLRTKT